ncbi:DUF4124 domain-containing protein [Halomonas chromatireducens]|uniref:DUF4124 domain-containing protein n=1 Tax=Halomonas chromatireducens TaxID=507626 RepID=A0A0X8HAM0_9GAMM|nr:DUF4124 domain-containing protein [Halomonas chromatireducens]AMC99127.1 hypothetical protein LOKO_00023 [Halomonas chromatireducens]
MKKALLVIIGLLVASSALATTIYRTVDSQGNVIFTDSPGGGGEPVELAPLTVVPSRELPGSAEPPRVEGVAPRASASPGQPFMPYDVFRIASPANGAELAASHAGNVQVELTIEPELRPDHQARLLVNGRVSQTAMHTAVFMLTDLDRGQYVIQAELLDGSGEIRHRTQPVTLHVRRSPAG